MSRYFQKNASGDYEAEYSEYYFGSKEAVVKFKITITKTNEGYYFIIKDLLNDYVQKDDNRYKNQLDVGFAAGRAVNQLEKTYIERHIKKVNFPES